MRLNSLESAAAKLESGSRAIVPSTPSESELLKRITSEDEDERMPPREKPLTTEQIAAIRQWIANGAPWKNPWAFEPLLPQTPPAVKRAGWVKNPIDAFVLARLEARGLEPAPAAEKRALLRRAYYDLTGLPPAPAEIDAFVADEKPDAFERVVDRLLASPHYGERWARHWLDVVRYAESNSFERDGTKPHVWRYRDYVIRSLNADKPYDQFLREQLAGDELPQVTNDSIIATGFYRLGIWDDEPADRDQARFDGLDDLVTTCSQAFLGLTVNCARCHDHKIDPIRQRDYYQLAAIFAGLQPMATRGPQIEVPIFASPEKEAEFHAAERALEEDRKRAQQEFQALETQFIAKFQEEQSGEVRRPDLETLEYRFYRDTWDRLPDFSNLKPESIGPLDGGYIDLSPATRDTAFGFVFTGSLLVPEDGEYVFLLDSDDGSRLRLNGKVVAEYDGIHGLGTPQRGVVLLSKGIARLELEYFQKQHGLGLSLEWSGPGFDHRPLTATKNAGERLAVGKGDQLRSEDGRFLRKLIESDGRRLLGAPWLERYQAAHKKLQDVNHKSIPADYALSAHDIDATPPPMHLLERGNPHAEGALVDPGFPAILGGGGVRPPDDAARDRTSQRRLQFAEWLVSPDNKLTARVIANRVWQNHFGRGIVRSPNNFGNLGVPPTHPELLDWLAHELTSSGWRLKPLHRLIMLSSAYQMSSRGSDAAATIDPANDLWQHFDLRRLSAEEVRDSILAVDGRLNPKMFGPSVFPELSPEVLATQSHPGLNWGKSSPEEQARRSIYIHVKRSLAVPLLASFDFPETDVSCEARFMTTQPGQALGMMNSDFVNGEAAAFATRLQREAGDDPQARIDLALRLALGRSASSEESSRCLAFIADLKTRFSLSDDAAWKSFCLTVFSRNEFIYLD